MKKAVALILSLALLCWLGACTKENKEAVFLDFEAQYIRTNSFDYEENRPQAVLISSDGELSDYYLQNKSLYDLERKETVYSDTTIGFLDAADRYNSSFFQDKALIFIILIEGSGSVRHRVEQVTVSPVGATVEIKTLSSEVGTCDMAAWHIIIEIDKEHAPTDPQNISVIKS